MKCLTLHVMLLCLGGLSVGDILSAIGGMTRFESAVGIFWGEKKGPAHERKTDMGSRTGFI